jgi:hypothetical protein
MKKHDPLAKLGEFVMKNLRDKAIDKAEGLLRAEWKAPSLKPLQAELSKLDANQKALVRRCVVSAIDTGIHDFLFALQERADFENDIELRVDGKNVVELSDGIHGEAFGEDGWMKKFSAHGSPPAEA